MGSTHEMSALLAKRDARIRELEIENMELKSKLDKYQMIFTGNSFAIIINCHYTLHVHLYKIVKLCSKHFS